MCGIAGLLNNNGWTRDATEEVIRAMTAPLAHRGPDDTGVWVRHEAGVALGHRRLSIIDLSREGHQPMSSSDGRYVIVYNGEVYNFPAISKELAELGHVFRGHSDTEVILATILEFGLEQAVTRFIGMFALALWDSSAEELFLVRDRLGIKPLYWGHSQGWFLFASELKSFRQIPGFKAEINGQALHDYMRLGFIPAPGTIYENVFKLEPGTILKVRRGAKPAITYFWRMEDVVRGAGDRISVDDETDAITAMEQLIAAAVKDRMIADVPLGTFLSGGIDSATITALMQHQSKVPVRTFTVGFKEGKFNEAHFAGRIAAHLGTDHTEIYVSSRDALDVIPGIPDIYDEPFADSSQLPTYLISKLARQHVTVILSGDGGDEVFAGYKRYLNARRLLKYTSIAGAGHRKLLAGIITASLSAVLDRIPSSLPGLSGITSVRSKLERLARILESTDTIGYRHFLKHWQASDKIVLDNNGGSEPDWHKRLPPELTDLVEQMQYLDTINYLPEDILTKVDRASMAVSLEVRVPLLDHRVVEQAWTLPLAMKIRDGRGKWIVRQILRKYIPMDLVERRKMGFTVPVSHWLRGPLRDWGESLLEEQKLREQGLLNHELIRTRWVEHLKGRRNWPFLLWTVLMFQAWYERWMH
jgi:asparagine synthase (glutamine-hydrolysing)